MFFIKKKKRKKANPGRSDKPVPCQCGAACIGPVQAKYGQALIAHMNPYHVCTGPVR